jgi:hypothetical protein
MDTEKKSNKISVENLICPICQQLLLKPVMADDGFFYNEHCFTQYIKNNSKFLRSPVTRKPITKKYTPVIMIRNYIIDLIKNTNLLDEYFQDMTHDSLIQYGLLDELKNVPELKLRIMGHRSDQKY